MGDLQRSAEMAYLQVFVPEDASADFAHELAKQGLCQVTDLNHGMDNSERPHMREIVRLQEIEKTVGEIEDFLDGEGIKRDAKIRELDLHLMQSKSHQIEPVEGEVSKSFKELKEQLQVLSSLNAKFNSNKNAALVCQASHKFRAQQADVVNELGGQDSNYQGDEGVGFKHISGMVSVAQRHVFQRQVFLTTRGNSYMLFDDVDDENSAFMVYYLGDRIQAQLGKLCDYMQIGIHLTSEDSFNLDEHKRKLESENEETQHVINETERRLLILMKEVEVKLKRWRMTLIQEKCTRVTLNKFKRSANNLECNGWCAKKNIDRIQECLDKATAGKGGADGALNVIKPPKDDTPPTYFETNKFTEGFQVIINTYGVPRYREYNPTVPTLMTFPFLFAMMYGDVFHGTIVFLIALSFVLREKSLADKKLDELSQWLYGGRYIMLMMGTFAIYNGFIYNDCISLSMTIWSDSTYYEEVDDTGTLMGYYDGVYPFGLDPVWHGKDEQIEYTNSIKMKMSVLFGVTQMSFGLILCALNHIEYKDWISLLVEWIPQVVFMVTFFVYMDFMIIYKWTVNWEHKDYSPPSLITCLVNMVLAPGSIEAGDTQLYDDADFQADLQFWMAMAMLLSVPLMLCCKPCVLWCKYGGKKKGDEYSTLDHGDDELAGDDEKAQHEAAQTVKEEESHGGGGHGHGHGGELDIGDVSIHQMIHTIEYVLGTVSNTASYLRLWALSLAHAQLSEVFYEMTLLETMKGSSVNLFVGATIFYACTFGVLIVMDQLECFLHALRLHWVEFQNKFYNADGEPFEPLSYKRLLKQLSD